MPKLREPPKRDDEEKPVPVTTAGQSELQPEQREEAAVAPQPDDNSEELKRQLETLRRSESTARQQAQQAAQQRDAAIRYAQERDVALSRSQKDVSDSRLEAIQSGIATAEAEAAEASRAYRSASIEQDIDAQIAANERLAEAKANLVNLTNGKAAMERGIAEEQERIKNQPPPQQQQQGDALDRTNLPQTAKNWLRSHPEYLTDSRKNAKIQSLHWDVLDEGHQPFTDKYYESLEVHLGLRAKPRQEAAEEDEGDEQPAVRRSIVSAPVTREAPSSGGTRTSGTVRLTAQQREMAKASGITEAEYAKQVVNLQLAKANGNYGGAP